MRLRFEVIVFFSYLICYVVSNSTSSFSNKKVFLPAAIENFDTFDSIDDILTHERYARHVQTITESVVDHIVKELNKFPEVRKRRRRGKLNQIAENLNTMMQILKRKRMGTRKRRKEKNGTKTSSVFWKNKFMLHPKT